FGGAHARSRRFPAHVGLAPTLARQETGVSPDGRQRWVVPAKAGTQVDSHVGCNRPVSSSPRPRGPSGFARKTLDSRLRGMTYNGSRPDRDPSLLESASANP